MTTKAPERAVRRARPWRPAEVVVTPSSLTHPWGRSIAERCEGLGLPVRTLRADRLEAVRGESPRDAYRRAKSTLAVVVSPPGERRLRPIPPSADWQFHLARGCPAHCHYCYLAGSLSGPPVVRTYANLDEILAGLVDYEGRGEVTSASPERAGEGTTFEASCYTDPLGIEHLTGSLARAIEHFGARPGAGLRFTTKYDAVEPLLGLAHGRRTRARFSLNATAVTRPFEGGTAPLESRLVALRRMARAGYPVGLVIAPIMPFEGWREGYAELIDMVADALDGVPDADPTVELITHRFTAGSKEVLRGWYPASRLEMDEEARAQKRNRFGGAKHVYPAPVMRELRGVLEDALAARLPGARTLYFT